ncbi:MAG: hypothetical protein ACK5A0_05985 [Polaromonas sp.]|jgi:hypothetical protein
MLTRPRQLRRRAAALALAGLGLLAVAANSAHFEIQRGDVLRASLR